MGVCSRDQSYEQMTNLNYCKQTRDEMSISICCTELKITSIHWWSVYETLFKPHCFEWVKSTKINKYHTEKRMWMRGVPDCNLTQHKEMLWFLPTFAKFVICITILLHRESMISLNIPAQVYYLLKLSVMISEYMLQHCDIFESSKE